MFVHAPVARLSAAPTCSALSKCLRHLSALDAISSSSSAALGGAEAVHIAASCLQLWQPWQS